MNLNYRSTISQYLQYQIIMKLALLILSALVSPLFGYYLVMWTLKTVWRQTLFCSLWNVTFFQHCSILHGNKVDRLSPCQEPNCIGCHEHLPHQRFHCPVCPITVYKPSTKSKVTSHLMSHIKTAVKVEGKSLKYIEHQCFTCHRSSTFSQASLLTDSPM